MLSNTLTNLLPRSETLPLRLHPVLQLPGVVHLRPGRHLLRLLRLRPLPNQLARVQRLHPERQPDQRGGVRVSRAGQPGPGDQGRPRARAEDRADRGRGHRGGPRCHKV